MDSHYPDIVCDDTPQNFGLKMFPTFPHAAAKVIPSFDIGDNILGIKAQLSPEKGSRFAHLLPFLSGCGYQ